MLSYDSVVAFAERAKTLKRLDIVVFNAGVMTGHEETIQGNFLSTALLTILLLPILKSKDTNEPSRMVWVQSDMVSWAKFKEQDSTPLLPTLDKPESFNLPDRYSTSKLLGQLFINELTKKVPSSIVTITMPNLGLCYGTGLGTLPGRHIGEIIASWIKRILGRSSSVGARTITDAAVNHGPDAHGQYLEDCKIQS